jgi:hypothetical protein
MDPQLILIFVLIIFFVGFLFYSLGKQIGREEIKREILEKISRPVEEINEILGEVTEQREQYIFAVRSIDRNNGKIPTREVYDIIYNSYLVEGKLYCSCGDPDTCDVFRVLREYKDTYKNQFTEEELNRNDGL